MLCIGAAAIFGRFALTGTGPLEAAALRLLLAAFCVLGIARLRGAGGRPTPRGERRLFAAGVALAIHFGAWLASLEFTSVAVSTLLVCTSPIFTGAYDAVLRRRAPSRFYWIALVLGGAGLWLVVASRAASVPAGGHQLAGAALATLGSLAMATYLTIVRDLHERLTTLRIVSRTYTWAAALLVVAALALREAPPALNDGTAWAGIVAMALISQVGGHTALNAALRYLTPTTVGFATLLEPVFAAALAAAIFGEMIGFKTLLGGLVLLAATGFSLRDETRLSRGML